MKALVRLPARRAPSLLALAVCLFCVVLGARWCVIDRFGTDLPLMDEWDAQGLDELAPWFGGTFGVQNLFHPHNEHRVVLTKVLNLALALANRQWDQRLEAVVNAVFPAVIAGAFFLLGCHQLAGRWHAPLFFLLGLLYGAPLAWESIVRGFDSQQFFLIGLSAGAIVLLPFASIRRGRWWLGATCLILALGSMASGFFVGVIVGSLLILRAVRREVRWAEVAPGLLLCAIVVAIGVATRVVVAANAVLMAQNSREFFLSLVRALGWPAFDQGIGAASLLLWLPWIALAAWIWWRRTPRTSPGEYMVLGLGAWAVLQMLATAYARGSAGLAPASRYIDNLVVGIFANGVAAAIEWEGLGAGQVRRLLGALAGLVWISLLGLGLAAHLDAVLTQQLPADALHDFYCVQNVRNYLATGDRAYLQHNELPYPKTSDFYARISVPALRALMPASVRPPLGLIAAPAAAGFLRLDTRSPERRAPAAQPAPGLSPDTPPPANAVVWGSFGRSAGADGPAWSSLPVRRTIPGWLRFDVAGDLGLPGTELVLRDPRTDQVIAVVRPKQVPGPGWHAAYVPAPANEFVVAARTAAPERWFAFSQPVEVGELSYAAWRAERQGPLLAAAGLGVALLIMVLRSIRSGI